MLEILQLLYSDRQLDVFLNRKKSQPRFKNSPEKPETSEQTIETYHLLTLPKKLLCDYERECAAA